MTTHRLNPEARVGPPVRRLPTRHAVIDARTAAATRLTTLADLLDFADGAELDQLWVVGDDAPRATQTAAGWTLSYRPGDWWARGYRPGGRDRAIVFPQRNTAAGNWDSWADADADTLNRALTLYTHVIGSLPERSPGSSAHRLLRRQHAGPKALPLSPAHRLTEKLNPAVGPLVWMAQPDAMPRGRAYLHSYDKHAMYLGACSSLPLGCGVPYYYDTAQATAAAKLRPLQPGYWYAAIDGPWAAGPPPADGRRTGWYPTSTIAHLLELPDWHVDVMGAQLWPGSYRPLEPWYRVLRDARTALTAVNNCQPGPAATVALSAIKALYTQGIGWFAASAPGWDRGEDPLYRPDWFDAVMTAARANLLRNVAAAGIDPIAVQVDCLYLLSDEPDPTRACGGLKLGAGIGMYAVKDATIPVGEVQGFLDAGELGPLSRYLNERRRRS